MMRTSTPRIYAPTPTPHLCAPQYPASPLINSQAHSITLKLRSRSSTLITQTQTQTSLSLFTQTLHSITLKPRSHSVILSQTSLSLSSALKNRSHSVIHSQTPLSLSNTHHSHSNSNSPASLLTNYPILRAEYENLPSLRLFVLLCTSFL